MYVLYEKEDAEGFHSARVRITKEFYNQYKDEIWHILGSLEY
ncbi:hypothetical protein [Alkaliphilus hydrothermalis]|uniref:Uncharacterized protein n=1 Tax=Alkaliphilus hydrothermalis TaxID=1482730 RepID=A0ABS2NRW2_9FIRM|nr:hypothetical protein [Alkaliphilus hydrothermalis]MBM7615704.1 hypothetical protein [Alkaliphilus hydrothermalis]